MTDTTQTTSFGSVLAYVWTQYIAYSGGRDNALASYYLSAYEFLQFEYDFPLW